MPEFKLQRVDAIFSVSEALKGNELLSEIVRAEWDKARDRNLSLEDMRHYLSLCHDLISRAQMLIEVHAGD